MHNSITCQKPHSASAAVMAAGLLLVCLNTRKNGFEYIAFPREPIVYLQGTGSVAELQRGRDIIRPCACGSGSDL